MKTNIGSLDRLIRVLLATVLLYLGFFLYNGSALGVGLIAVGGILFTTALIGFCGLYRLLGIYSNQPNKQL